MHEGEVTSVGSLARIARAAMQGLECKLDVLDLHVASQSRCRLAATVAVVSKILSSLPILVSHHRFRTLALKIASLSLCPSL